MIFVHARGETVRTARWLLNNASQSGDLQYFEPPHSSQTPEFIKRVSYRFAYILHCQPPR